MSQARDEWVSHLSMLLVNQATHETAKLMARADVLEELRGMSAKV